MSVSGRKLAKRACDGCKIRKIKCTEVAPCAGCVAAGIACTFVKQPSTRGPRRLRKTTLREITQSQQQWEDLGFGSSVPVEPVVHTKLDEESVFAPNKVAALVLQLCVYRLRVYPIWPIIKVERLVASLQKPEPDIEVFGLAYAVAAATIVQIRAQPSARPGEVTAEMMEAQCQYAKARRNRDQPPDLTTVRIPFFLHMYYESIEPGGLQSITYLREAIAVAHMIGLHRETYYTDVQLEEREIRRRTLWLLFVAERNISISHKLPVTIRTKIAFPSTIDSDSEHVLAAYQQLVSLFWEFDRSGVFELLDRSDYNFTATTRHIESLQPTVVASLTTMRKLLDENPINTQRMEDSQAFYLLITRQWMRMVLWRLLQPIAKENGYGAMRQGLAIAKDLLDETAHTPELAIEAHSFVNETKIYEMTISILAALEVLDLDPNVNEGSLLAEEIKSIMIRFRAFLSRNDNLCQQLRRQVDELQRMKIDPSIHLALSAVLDDRMKIIDAPSTDTNTSYRASESSPSSTGIVSGSQTGESPQSFWFNGPGAGRQSNSIGSVDAVISSSQYLDEMFSDMEWSQYGQNTEPETLITSTNHWLDMNFAFNAS